MLRTPSRPRIVPLSLLAVAALALPAPAGAAERARRPPGTAAIHGVLEVVQEDDFAGDRTRRSVSVVDARTGRRYGLRLDRLPDVALRTGQSVVVRGRLEADELTVGGPGEGLHVVAAAIEPFGGRRPVVVLVVDFAGSPVACSDEAIAERMFTGEPSVRGLYRDSSGGGLLLDGDADGDGRSDVFRVSLDAPLGESCDPYGWAAAAERAAGEAGVDLGLYRHRLIVLPRAARCGWAGLANVGCGEFCRGWVRTCEHPDVYAHEIGHNLGMAHASTDDDNDGAVDCEYCDRSDFMGSAGAGWRGLNGPHEIQQGWLSGDRVRAVDQEGVKVHGVSALREDRAAAPYPQALTFPRPLGGESYFATYRTRQGHDAALDEPYVARTSIHRYAGSGYERTVLVGLLDDGESFEDAAAGLRITQLAHDDGSATLEVDAWCVPAAPSLRVAPPSAWSRPGVPETYEVGIVNRDSPVCPGTTFTLAAQAPPGWTVEPVTVDVALGSGQRAEVDLSVTAPADASDGGFPLIVSASAPGQPEHAAAAEWTQNIDGTGPTAVTDLTASLNAEGRVWLRWSPSSDAGSGVASYRVFRDGTFVGSALGPAYLAAPPPPGLRQVYRVTAVDRAGNESVAGNAAAIGDDGSARPAGGGRGRLAPRRY